MTMKKQTKAKTKTKSKAEALFDAWRNDWNKFLVDVFDVNLDEEQRAIISAVQRYPRVSVRSGTARGKDFVSACAAMCFMYLTPRWGKDGALKHNTKVALTAPTGRQVGNIMMPEIARLYARAGRRGFDLGSTLTRSDIRTDNPEWFLTGFKADEHNHEAWSGFHAVNTMFVITEASGISDDTFSAIEGNLQGNSRILIVFNPNTSVGYAAKSQRDSRWKRFTLSSLSAPNVKAKKTIIHGQVDWDWVDDKVENWCTPIAFEDINEADGDFIWEGQAYKPNDLFRIKVLGIEPKVSEDVLIPPSWIERAEANYARLDLSELDSAIVGIDVAGMGRDSSVFAFRHRDVVSKIKSFQSGGRAEHMRVAGEALAVLKSDKGAVVSIDTIGEGAGVYARIAEEAPAHGIQSESIVSCKFSERAVMLGRQLNDETGLYTFANMRAYCYWCLREWLDPSKNPTAALPPNSGMLSDCAEIRWFFNSRGDIQIEAKEDIKERLGRSPDTADALANTFHPEAVRRYSEGKDYEPPTYLVDDILA